MSPWLRPPTAVRVVFDGQSLNTVPPAPENYPTLVMRGLGVPWSNVALGGTSWTTLATTATTRRDVTVNQATTCMLVMNGGEQDLIDGDTGAQIYADMGTYRTSALAAGFTHVAATTIPPISSFWGTFTQRTVANGLIIADASSYFDAVVDLDVAPLDDPTDTTYYIDGVHWTAAGAATAAALVRPAVVALLAA